MKKNTIYKLKKIKLKIKIVFYLHNIIIRLRKKSKDIKNHYLKINVK